MKTKVKTLTYSTYYNYIDEEINQEIKEIEEENHIIENIKITGCGQSNVFVLIIYKEKDNDNGLDYLNYCSDDNIDNTLYINNSQTTATYEMKTSM